MDKKREESKLSEVDENTDLVQDFSLNTKEASEQSTKKKRLKKKKEPTNIDEDIDYYLSMLETEKITDIKEEKKKTPFLSWYPLLIIGLVVTISCFVIFIFFQYDKVEIKGNHMASHLKDSNHVLYKEDSSIRRFNVVLVKEKDSYQALRVIGMPGDKIEMKDDVLTINEAIYDEVYLKENYVDFKLANNQLKKVYTEDFNVASIGNIKSDYVPKNSYILLGDNRQEAKDSRQLGFFKRDQIDGVILMKIKPYEELGPVE